MTTLVKSFIYFTVIISFSISTTSCKFKKKPLLFWIFPNEDSSKSIILENETGLFTNELGKTTSFTIKLNTKPNSNVVIGPIVSLDETEGKVISSSTITFNADNYDTPQTITVEGMDDSEADDNQDYKINFGSITTNDYNYSKQVIPEVTITNTDDEKASIAVSPTSGLSTNEGGTSTSFNVVLSTKPGTDVVVSGFSSDNTSECSVSGSLTFTPDNWDTPQQVTVSGIDDFSIDGPQNCVITSTTSTSDDSVYQNKTISPVTVINVDNDVAGFTIIPNGAAITTEGGSQAQFSIVMNTLPYGDVSVSGITTSDTTEATVSPMNITFTPSDWNTPQTIVLSGVDDNMEDGDINYTVVFPNSTSVHPSDSDYNGLALPSAGSFTNQDNDTRGFDITSSSVTITEGGTSQTFQIRLTSAPCDTPSTPETCSPGSFTMNLTNSNTSQYTIDQPTLTFDSSNWNTYQTITLDAVNDLVDDGDLNFTLVLESITGSTDYTGMDPSDLTINVIDDDTAAFIISPAGGVTVNENDPGATGLETTITVKLNSEPTGNVTLGPVISTDTGEITIAPANGVNDPISNRTLVFTPTSGQAVTTSDSDSDTFHETTTSGWDVEQTIRVRAVVDGTLDGTQNRAIQFGSRSTTDTLYSNPVATPTPDVPATNVDSGTPIVLLQSISAVSYNEDGSSTITFDIVLATLPTSDVTISNITSLDTSEGVVLPNGGGAPITNRTLTFTTATNVAPTGTNTTTGGWNMPQTVTIRSVGDDFDDGDIPFLIQIPQATGAAEYVNMYPESSNGSYNQTTGQLTLTNNDNDTRGFTITSPTITVTEGAGNQTFDISLTSDPCSTPSNPENCNSDSITINLTNNDTDQYSVAPTSLTFTAGSWNTPQTVTISPVNDNFDENDMNFTLVLEQITGSSDYGFYNMNPNDVSIVVQDNDARDIVLTPDANYGDVTSGSGGYTVYNLQLGSRPLVGNTVTITIASSDTTEGGVILDSDDTTELASRDFTFNDTNWSTNQTFRVKGKTSSGSGSTTYNLDMSASEVASFPTYYINYNGFTKTRTITNYHIDPSKKIRLASNTTSMAENGGSASYWVLLNQAPTDPVTITFGIDSSFPCTLPATVGSTTQFTVDTASVVLDSSNWNQIVTTNRLDISGYNDLVDDGDVSCDVKITSVTSSDPYYNGLTTTDYEEPSITITDNDAIGIARTNQDPIDGVRLITSSSGTTATLDYRLNSKPMDDVTLNFSTDVPGIVNFSVPSLTFTPANYSTWQSITITGTASTSPTQDENYTIIATASSGETTTGFANSGIYNTTVSNQNAKNRFNLYDLVSCTSTLTTSCEAVNTTPPEGGTVTSTYTTSEPNTPTYFAIALRAKPSSNVNISFSSSDTTEGTVSPSNLTFTSGNWDTLQVVTITGVDDDVADGNIPYSIDFSAMTGDASFTTTIPSLSVTNTDDDVSGFTLTPTSATGVLESDLGSSFTVRLNSEPTANVTIPLSSLDLTITNPASQFLNFTPANWSTPQTVDFTWTSDGSPTPATRNHSIQLDTVTSSDTNYNGSDPTDYTISITNTD